MRLACRHGLCFHIDRWGTLRPSGYRDKPQEATEYELDLWMLLIPDSWKTPPFEFPTARFQPRVLDAEPRELESLSHRENVTVSAEDLAVMRSLPLFLASSDSSELRRGLFGRLGSASVFVSRLIPQGYFHDEALEAWRPPPGSRVLAPPPPESLRYDIRPLCV